METEETKVSINTKSEKIKNDFAQFGKTTSDIKKEEKIRGDFATFGTTDDKMKIGNAGRIRKEKTMKAMGQKKKKQKALNVKQGKKKDDSTLKIGGKQKQKVINFKNDKRKAKTTIDIESKTPVLRNDNEVKREASLNKISLVIKKEEKIRGDFATFGTTDDKMKIGNAGRIRKEKTMKAMDQKKKKQKALNVKQGKKKDDSTLKIGGKQKQKVINFKNDKRKRRNKEKMTVSLNDDKEKMKSSVIKNQRGRKKIAIGQNEKKKKASSVKKNKQKESPRGKKNDLPDKKKKKPKSNLCGLKIGGTKAGNVQVIQNGLKKAKPKAANDQHSNKIVAKAHRKNEMKKEEGSFFVAKAHRKNEMKKEEGSFFRHGKKKTIKTHELITNDYRMVNLNLLGGAELDYNANLKQDSEEDEGEEKKQRRDSAKNKSTVKNKATKPKKISLKDLSRGNSEDKSNKKKGEVKEKLSEGLPGFIFYCNESTESDCLKYCVFGGKKSDINNFQSYIKPFETLLFLWNRSTETYVDGVFLAISRLELSICKQVSWHERYTAQVQVQNVYKTQAIRKAHKNYLDRRLTGKKVMTMLNAAGVDQSRLYRNVLNWKKKLMQQKQHVKIDVKKKVGEMSKRNKSDKKRLIPSVTNGTKHKLREVMNFVVKKEAVDVTNSKSAIKNHKKSTKPTNILLRKLIKERKEGNNNKIHQSITKKKHMIEINELKPLKTPKEKTMFTELMCRNQEEVDITENPFLIIDARNVAYNSDAPSNCPGEAIEKAMKDLISQKYEDTNILFIMPRNLEKQCEKSSMYNEIKETYRRSFSTLSERDGTNGDEWWFLNTLLKGELRHMRPIIISTDKSRSEMFNWDIPGDLQHPEHRTLFRNFLKKSVKTFSWMRGRFELSHDVPPSQLLEESEKHGSSKYVFPKHEMLRKDCIQKCTEKIVAVAVENKVKDFEKKYTVRRKVAKAISNWIFDCSRDGTICQTEDEQWTLIVRKGPKNSILLDDKDYMLPEKNVTTEKHFLKRLGNEFNIFQGNKKLGCKLYNDVMNCMEKSRIKIQKTGDYKSKPVVTEENSITTLKISQQNANRGQKLFTEYYEKLCSDHDKARINNKFCYARNLVDERILSMLQRYHTLWGENSGAQGALPDKVFEVLRKRLKVEGECFASPLNHRLDKFYSAFPDTDKCFGSLGSFFDDDNKHMVGSWEANPPFDKLSVQNTLLKITELLSEAEKRNETLSFIVFFAEFGGRNSVRKLLKKQEFEDLNFFQRCNKYIKDTEHVYKHGFQHEPQRSKKGKIHWKPDRATEVYLFQTTCGYNNLGKTEAQSKNTAESILGAIKRAFKQPL